MTWLRSLSLIEWWKCAGTPLSLVVSAADVLVKRENKSPDRLVSL